MSETILKPELLDVAWHRQLSNKIGKAIKAAGLEFTPAQMVIVVGGVVTKPPGFIDVSGSKIERCNLNWQLPPIQHIHDPATEAAFVQRILSQIPFLQTSAEKPAPSTGDNGHEKGQEGLRLVRP